MWIYGYGEMARLTSVKVSAKLLLYLCLDLREDACISKGKSDSFVFCECVFL